MRQWLIACGLMLLAACSKQEPPAPATEPAVPSAAVPAPGPSAAVATPEPSASAAAAPDLPVEEDFEDEANLKVNAVTLDAQLDALEKEIKAN